MLEKLQIDPAMLAKVYESPEITGEVTQAAAELTGLAPGTPVVGGRRGQRRGGRGHRGGGRRQGLYHHRHLGVVFAHTDKISIDPKGRVHTFCCAVPGPGTLWRDPGGGAVPQVVPGQLLPGGEGTAAGLGVDPYVLMDQEAPSPPLVATAFVPALPHGERTPHLDPDCRGVFFGLSAIHTKRDMLRAVMEGVTYSQRDSVEILRAWGSSSLRCWPAAAGGAPPVAADAGGHLQLPVKTVKSKEGPALGVAILAGVGGGLYPSVQQACKAMIHLNPAQEPIRRMCPSTRRTTGCTPPCTRP